MSVVSTTPMAQPSQPIKANKRIQLESLLREFQSKLGANWEKYHDTLTLFLVGKISRVELVEIVGPLLKNGLGKYHNRLLLLNFANSLDDSPVEFSTEIAFFWNKKNAKAKNVKSSQYEKFKQNIMGLPLKERRRIRSITKDSGKKNKLNAYITLTRQALLPKIPMIQDKEQQQLQVNNLVQWQQDVVNGINTPLSSSTYELPDVESLSRRVLMTMRENGLVGGVDSRVLEVISLGLDTHLRNIIECAIDTVRYRKKKYASSTFLLSSLSDVDFLLTGPNGKSGKNDLSSLKNGPSKNGPSNLKRGLSNLKRGASSKNSSSNLKKRKYSDADSVERRDVVIGSEDIYGTLEMFPHLIEPCGPKYRLANVMLQNDDLIDLKDCGYVIPPKPPSTVAEEISTTTDLRNGHGKSETPAAQESTESGRKLSVLSPQLKPTPSSTANPYIGTVEELKWLLHDLIST